MSQALASQGAATAYRAVMHPEARFMRTGVQPVTSRDAALAWLAKEVAWLTTEPTKAETGASGDLGYTWGKLSVRLTSGAAYTGYYIRIWTRQADGTWVIAADIATPPPAPKKP
jgi:ketosteroid isomerase-like protein